MATSVPVPGRAIAGMSGTDQATIADMSVIDGTYTLTSAPANAVALAPIGAEYTAFTGELLALLRDGVPAGPELLTLGDIYRRLRRTMIGRGLPVPQQRGTGNADLLALARNRAFVAPVPTSQPVGPQAVMAPPPPVTLNAERLRTLVKRAFVYTVAFSADGTQLALASGKDAELLDLTGRAKIRVRHHGHFFAGYIRDIAVAPDGRRFVTATDTSTPIWDTRQGKPESSQIGVGGASRVAFSPDGRCRPAPARAGKRRISTPKPPATVPQNSRWVSGSRQPAAT